MKIIAERKEEMNKKNEKETRRDKMNKIAVLVVMAVVILSFAKESFAYWKPTAGTVVCDPAPMFEEITIK